jgi:hypothetical protein
MRLWYWDEPEFVLERQFPNDDQMRWMNRFLSQLAVEREAGGAWPDASQLLREDDAVLDIMQHRGQVMQRHKLTRCVLCGRGHTKVSS